MNSKFLLELINLIFLPFDKAQGRRKNQINTPSCLTLRQSSGLKARLPNEACRACSPDKRRRVEGSTGFRKNCSALFLLLFISWSYSCVFALNAQRSIGLFCEDDPNIEGMLYANWGSRPYEYYWAATVTDIKDKKVIDIGMGIPSQSSWYLYVVEMLRPALYVGIDYDGRMLNEQSSTKQYELTFMNAAKIKHPDSYFDVAFAISSLHCMPYKTLMKSVAEIHRVLAPEGLFIVTLDERWDYTQLLNHANSWNTLEQDLIKKDLFNPNHRSFGMPDFLVLIQDYFELINQDAYIDDAQNIVSKTHENFYYHRNNKSETILHSVPLYNSCVSYAVLKKKTATHKDIS